MTRSFYSLMQIMSFRVRKGLEEASREEVYQVTRAQLIGQLCQRVHCVIQLRHRVCSLGSSKIQLQVFID